MTVTLPLPSTHLRPNTRRHWRYVAAATKEYRAMAQALFMAAKRDGPVGVPVVVSATWYMGESKTEAAMAAARSRMGLKPLPMSYRPNDIQNAISALKAAIDGMVDAGIVPSDNHRWVTWGPQALLRTAKEHCGRSGVVLEVTARDGKQ